LGISRSSAHRLIKEAEAATSQATGLGQELGVPCRLIVEGDPSDQPSPAELPITGAEGYTIREDGIVKRHGKRVEPEEIGLYRANKHKNGYKFRTRAHLGIYLENYQGRVPAIGKTAGPNWWSQWNGPDDAAPQRERELRLLDELVAYEFLPRTGSTPKAWEFLDPIHLDGNEQNCSAANLRCIGAEASGHVNTVSLMRCSYMPPRGVSRASRTAGAHKEPMWTGANNVPGHVPTSSGRAK
jgi:hypothetical protein